MIDNDCLHQILRNQLSILRALTYLSHLPYAAKRDVSMAFDKTVDLLKSKNVETT